MFKRINRWIGRARPAKQTSTRSMHIHPTPVQSPIASGREPESQITTGLSARFDELGLDESARRRILMTAGCQDCRSIPKILGAGQVSTESGKRFQLMHNGLKVVADGYCGQWMTELIRLLEGHHEPQEELVFSELLRHIGPNSVMVELGSYWAYYSLWFTWQIPNARTVMIEPDPNHLEIGRRNFELNGLDGEFHRYSVGVRSATPQPFTCESDHQTLPTPQVCVDDLFAKYDLPQIDLLLADIQGAELAMLEGAQEAIRHGRVRFMLISTHHHRIAGDPAIHQKCLHMVRKMGGHVMAEHSISESFSGDGLIAVSFSPADRVLPTIPVSRNDSANSLFPETECDLDTTWQAVRAAARALQAHARGDEGIAAVVTELQIRLAPLGFRLHAG